MKTRLRHLWDTLTSSYWFVPAVMLVMAFALAEGMLAIDRDVLVAEDPSDWLYAGGSDGARTLLSAVAGSVMTVAGVVFSITIAALTQASSQFGPRLLRNFMRDTGNQIVLGTFVATFLYCILVLRTIPSDDRGPIPHLSVTVSVTLAIASLCVLVFFIHHVSFSIQAPQVVARVWDELQATLERVFPARAGHDGPSPHGNAERDEVDEPFGPGGAVVRAERSGYVQAIDEAAILRVAVADDVRIKVVQRPGDFIVEGCALANVWPASKATDRFGGAVNDAFYIGRHRTPEQDVEFALNQMVEIAVRALSPGINDPYTAMTCVDWLGESLCRIAACERHTTYRYDDAGTLRAVMRVSTFEGMVDVAFDQIRQYGRTSVAVTIRLLESIARVAPLVHKAPQRAALRRQAEGIHRQSRDAVPDAGDRAAIDERFARALAALDADTGSDPHSRDVGS